MPNPMNALLGAAEGVIDAGQRAMLDRAELLRVKSMEDARRMVLDGLRVGAPLLCAGFGWVLVSVSAALALSEWVHPAVAALIVGLPHVVFGLGAARAALRRQQQPSLRRPAPFERWPAA